MKTLEEIKHTRTTNKSIQHAFFEKQAEEWINEHPEIERDLCEFGIYRAFMKQAASNPGNPKAIFLRAAQKVVDHFQKLGFSAALNDWSAGIWEITIKIPA